MSKMKWLWVVSQLLYIWKCMIFDSQMCSFPLDRVGIQFGVLPGLVAPAQGADGDHSWQGDLHRFIYYTHSWTPKPCLVTHTLDTSWLDYCKTFYMGLSLKTIWKLNRFRLHLTICLYCAGFLHHQWDALFIFLSGACPDGGYHLQSSKWHMTGYPKDWLSLRILGHPTRSDEFTSSPLLWMLSLKRHSSPCLVEHHPFSDPTDCHPFYLSESHEDLAFIPSMDFGETEAQQIYVVLIVLFLVLLKAFYVLLLYCEAVYCI